MQRRKSIYDSFAERYHAVRPGYPDELVDALCARIPSRGHVVEMGAGTGKLTRPLAERGCRLTAIELGKKLATFARKELAAFPDVTIVQVPFEEFEPGRPVDAIVSGQAWHWLDPATSYRRAAELLGPGGVLGLLWNMPWPNHSEFDRRIQRLYEAHLPELAVRREIDRRIADRAAEIEGSGAIRELEIQRADWERRFTAQEYVDLLDTHSDHLAIAEERRLPFYEAVTALIDSVGEGGVVTQRYTCALFLGAAGLAVS